MPETKLGKLSIQLIILIPILYYVGKLFGNTTLTIIFETIITFLTIAIGLTAVIKEKEKSWQVYLAIALSFLWILILATEMYSI